MNEKIFLKTKYNEFGQFIGIFDQHGREVQGVVSVKQITRLDDVVRIEVEMITSGNDGDFLKSVGK